MLKKGSRISNLNPQVEVVELGDWQGFEDLDIGDQFY